MSNGLIVSNCLSKYRKTDGEIKPNLIHQAGRIDLITANKVHNHSWVYEVANDQLIDHGQINSHPRDNAVLSASDEATQRQRNQHVQFINQDGPLSMEENM